VFGVIYRLANEFFYSYTSRKYLAGIVVFNFTGRCSTIECAQVVQRSCMVARSSKVCYFLRPVNGLGLSEEGVGDSIVRGF